MLHHCACFLGDGADRAFGDTVLMMCANSGELEMLFQLGECVEEEYIIRTDGRLDGLTKVSVV